MKISIQAILSCFLFVVGVAVATPAQIDERTVYTSSFNAMASRLMNWYGSLIIKDNDKLAKQIDSKWDRYRMQYPKNITNIKIVSTKMIPQAEAHQYKFVVEAQVNTDKNSERVNETFFFKVPYLKKPVIENIVRDKEDLASPKRAGLGSIEYQAREIAYAWLAYLDGVQDMGTAINIKQWLSQANYSIKIGNINEQGSVEKIVEKRKQYLAIGGHLLHSIDVIKVDGQPNTFVMDLIIEWKGMNQTGKPVLAKIHQQIEYQTNNNLLNVISIKETHLLPDIAPWMGFLC